MQGTKGPTIYFKQFKVLISSSTLEGIKIVIKRVSYCIEITINKTR